MAVLLVGVTTNGLAKDIEKLLASQVNEMNKSLPTMVAPTVRQETSLTTDNEIVHRYTIVNRPANVIAQRWPEQDRAVTRDACTDVTVAKLLERGVTITYLYYGSDGNLGGKVQVSAEKCGF